MKKMQMITVLLAMFSFIACNNAQKSTSSATKTKGDLISLTGEKLQPIEKSEEEWKKQLSPEAFIVLRKEGTERAFSGEYADNHEKGIYLCGGCDLPLFSSETKFESGTGWPSFWQPIRKEHVLVGTDNSYGMTRDEVECARCHGHLGHVFDDGPKPTGLRYCMNSVSLKFVKNAKMVASK